MLDVSVIIPVLNEQDSIASTVAATWSLGPKEVIVVDGGSTDETPLRAGQFGALVLHASRGRGVQQNIGARHARGDVLLFLHADGALPPDGVEQILFALHDPQVIGGAFQQRIDSTRPIYRWIEQGNAWRVARWGLAFGDQAIFLRRDVFERCGGFPETPLLEDLLLMRQVRTHGRFVLLPGPVWVSPRRWERQGVVRQTLRNWRILGLARLGVSPTRLAKIYEGRRH